MAAFADYLDLRLAVSDHVGNRTISDVFPRLVQSAEAILDNRLRTNEQITEDDITFTAGVAPLPADFLEMIHLLDAQSRPMRGTSISDTLQSGSQYYRYSIEGGNVHVYGITGDRTIRYYARIPTLTASVTTSNWLLARHPDVYLYAVGLEAAKFLKDAELSVVTQRLLDASLGGLTVNDERTRWANATVFVRGATP